MKFTIIFLVFLYTWSAVSFPHQSTKYRVRNEVTVPVNFDGPRNNLLSHWSAKCWICHIVISTIQTLFQQKTSMTKVANAIEYICSTFHIEDQRVCHGIVNEFKDEVLTVVDKVALNPDEICGYYLGKACGNVQYSFFPPWNVSIPPKQDTNDPPSASPQPGSPVSRVLQITDTHYDSWYEEGSNTKCGEPLCCRKNDGPAPKGVTPAGEFGFYNCDTPTATLNGLFEHVSKLKEKVDYIIWTGDVPAHNVWNQSRADQMNSIKVATKLFLQYFPNTKVFPALGNHESAPVNSFPPPFITGKQSNAWLLDTLAEAWGNWLPEECKETIRRGGFYTTLVNKGLRIISLNMNYCNNQNYWLMINSVDPAGQLEWLINVLQKAEAAKEKVHIIGHIPPGSGDCIKYWSGNYYRIINRYQSTIAAQFFGHTHHDHYELFYDEETLTTPTSIAYIGPSVTPFTELNPGFRIYEIDGEYSNSSRVVLNHETYIIDLKKANKLGVAEWEYEYNAKDAYKMPSLLPKDWNNLITRMEKDDTLFQTFYRNYVKQHVISKCDEGCRKSLLCSLREGRSDSSSELCRFSREDTKRHKAYMFSLRKC